VNIILQGESLMSHAKDPTLTSLPSPEKIEVGDMFGSPHDGELVIVLGFRTEKEKQLVIPQFDVPIAESVLLDSNKYAYLGRIPAVFLQLMQEEIGIDPEDDAPDSEDEEDDEEDDNDDLDDEDDEDEEDDDDEEEDEDDEEDDG
jgi:hypothetical protein